ncbi:hypothetical protein GCM10010411_76400 [Actinomadura fulvescens]|uniref:Uncharacterized protein n=1 Tax=Actinomadura fulvescens TaxID=46160 RepID=A0ABN3QJ91_9ACTN
MQRKYEPGVLLTFMMQGRTRTELNEILDTIELRPLTTPDEVTSLFKDEKDEEAAALRRLVTQVQAAGVQAAGTTQRLFPTGLYAVDAGPAPQRLYYLREPNQADFLWFAADIS